MLVLRLQMSSPASLREPIFVCFNPFLRAPTCWKSCLGEHRGVPCSKPQIWYTVAVNVFAPADGCLLFRCQEISLKQMWEESWEASWGNWIRFLFLTLPLLHQPTKSLLFPSTRAEAHPSQQMNYRLRFHRQWRFFENSGRSYFSKEIEL